VLRKECIKWLATRRGRKLTMLIDWDFLRTHRHRARLGYDKPKRGAGNRKTQAQRTCSGIFGDSLRTAEPGQPEKPLCQEERRDGGAHVPVCVSCSFLQWEAEIGVSRAEIGVSSSGTAEATAEPSPLFFRDTAAVRFRRRRRLAQPLIHAPAADLPRAEYIQRSLDTAEYIHTGAP
jgi:hypothetical protein